MNRNIKISKYPETFQFTTDEELPGFVYAEEVRQKILVEELCEQNISSPNHAYHDYVIEGINVDKKGNETWFLGS